MTKKEKRLKKENFMRQYSLSLIERYNAIIYPHFVKISLNGVVYDYYPGACKINEIDKLNWQDLSHEEFFKIWPVE